MTRDEALAGLAQGVINIAEGLTTIEKDSRVYTAMHELVQKDGAAMTVNSALEMVEQLIEFTGGAKVECWKKPQRSCMATVNPSWGRMLTKSEDEKMCPACRAYWLLCAARNELNDCRKHGG